MQILSKASSPDQRIKNWLWIVTGLIAVAMPIFLLLQANSARDRRLLNSLSKTAVTKLDDLAAIAGTQQVVHIEGTALGDPAIRSLDGRALAFQKLTVSGHAGYQSFVKYAPRYFCVSDGKGTIWVDSGDYVERGIYPARASARSGIATTLVAQYDQYVQSGQVVVASTIPKGAHVSLLGRVIKYERVKATDPPTHYVLHAPEDELRGEKLLIAG